MQTVNESHVKCVWCDVSLHGGCLVRSCPGQSGWGWTAVYRSHWLVCVLQVFSCHAAEQVLDHFRDRFIADMDAITVVFELLNEGVIDEGIKSIILREGSTKLQNEILHDCLKKRCTDDALRAVCDVIIRVRGNPRMRALGEDIKKILVAGKWCMPACLRACACVTAVAGPV